jgi:hypothetical protein
MLFAELHLQGCWRRRCCARFSSDTQFCRASLADYQARMWAGGEGEPAAQSEDWAEFSGDQGKRD